MSCELVLLRLEDDSEGGVGGSRSIPARGAEAGPAAVIEVGESVGLAWAVVMMLAPLLLFFVEDLRPRLLVQELLREVETSGGLGLSAEFEFDVDDDAKDDGGGSLRERVRRNALREDEAMDDSGLVDF